MCADADNRGEEGGREDGNRTYRDNRVQVAPLSCPKEGGVDAKREGVGRKTCSRQGLNAIRIQEGKGGGGGKPVRDRGWVTWVDDRHTRQTTSGLRLILSEKRCAGFYNEAWEKIM